LEELKQSAYVPHDYGWLKLALIHAGLGDTDEAFVQLNEAYQQRAYALLYLNVDPRFDGLRSDPRCADLLARIGPMNRS
jgi:hypothetical protein